MGFNWSESEVVREVCVTLIDKSSIREWNLEDNNIDGTGILIEVPGLRAWD
jgi:hypothetical protein